jgi:hypothetical protein
MTKIIPNSIIASFAGSPFFVLETYLKKKKDHIYWLGEIYSLVISVIILH